MPRKDKGSAAKVAALVAIGLLTSVYSLAEIAAALYFHSLALLSDGFHNLSDVIALVIAFWALRVRSACPVAPLPLVSRSSSFSNTPCHHLSRFLSYLGIAVIRNLCPATLRKTEIDRWSHSRDDVRLAAHRNPRTPRIPY